MAPGPPHVSESARSSGPNQPELRYLAIGRVTRAHGLRGELSVVVLTEFPERFETTEWVYVGNEYEADAYQLESYRWHKDNILIKLAGISNRTAAEQFRGQLVQVPLSEAVPLPEGTYYLYQMMGLQVITTTGDVLGRLIDVIETGANDVYVVDRNGTELLLPAIPDVIKSIDIDAGHMVIDPIDGLL